MMSNQHVTRAKSYSSSGPKLKVLRLLDRREKKKKNERKKIRAREMEKKNQYI